MKKNIELSFTNTREDWYEGLKLFYKNTSSKRRIKFFGSILILLVIITLPFGFNFLMPIYTISGVGLLFFPGKILWEYSRFVAWYSPKFCGPISVRLNDESVIFHIKRHTITKKWNQIKTFHNSEMVILCRRSYIPYINLLTAIPKRNVSEEDWNYLIALIKHKEIKKEIWSTKKKVSYAIGLVLLILMIELTFIWIYVILTQSIGFNLDPHADKTSMLFAIAILWMPFIVLIILKSLKVSVKRIWICLAVTTAVFVMLFILAVIYSINFVR